MKRRTPLLSLLVFLSAAVVAGCTDNPSNPIKLSSGSYRRMVSAFYTGVAALDAGDNDRARREFHTATSIEAREPAPYVDLAVLALRSHDLKVTSSLLEEAQRHSPEQANIEFLKGLVESQQGRSDAALGHLRTAVRLAPSNARMIFALIDELRKQSNPAAEGEVQQWLEAILHLQPDNLEALLESTRLAIKNNDRTLLSARLDQLTKRAPGWTVEAKARLADFKRAAAAGGSNAQVTFAYLRNVLMNTDDFRRSHAALAADLQAIGEPLRQFVRLPSPPPTAAAPDTALTFAPVPSSSPGKWGLALRLSGDAPPVSLVSDGKSLTLQTPTPAVLAQPGALSPDGVCAIDWNNDRKQDLALAGPSGLRLFQQGDSFRWSDVTARAGLPPSVVNGAYTAAWAVDVDLDGDLDLVLARSAGEPVVLRNNGDGTWKAISMFPGVSGVRALAWVDLDGDGDPDVVMIDGSGRLVLFDNERAGHYTRLAGPAGSDSVLALCVADADGNGTLDLVVLQADGALKRLSRKPDGSGWETAAIGRWASPPNDGTARLLSADLDNNGAVDLIASGSKGSQVWLGAGGGTFQQLPSAEAARVLSIEDMNGDGRPDLMGTGADGQAVRLVNQGRTNYQWVEVRPQAQAIQKGDQRNNSFGIGGEMQLRSGLLVQTQPIPGPIVHFGLGSNTGADVVRIVWPKGSAQAEFGYRAGQAVVADQRLTGSCPWLFAFDGRQIAFVGDVLFNSPLGLRINGQDTAGVAQTRDWVKIRGDQLQPHDGYYDLRLTGELWETDIFDYVALMTVDHPAGTEAYLDERFSIPPPELRVRVTAPARPFARATDDRGTDVSAVVRDRDGRYLDTFGLGQYQGVTRDHWVEVELPADAPQTGPLYLLANGWIHPTDSSINVAISQGSQARPAPLSLEVPDARGGWRTVHPNLGFPAGKNKTIIVDLTGLFPASITGPRRVRLRTNLEIYWDQLSWTTPKPEVAPVRRVLRPDVAELRYRGFSYVHQASASSPETPDYGEIQTTGQMWRDLIGYYTRFGDVRELLAKADDRYVLLNAGDEIALRFPEQAPPPAGWVRDYVFISDGWDKDGNLNTGFSKTLLPLPSHAHPEYNALPTRLEEDPVYRAHPDDWKNYHTRYVTPDRFRRGLWGPTAP